MIFFDEPNPGRRTGAVVRQSSPGFWLIKDQSNRYFTAAGTKTYRAGENVAVVAGQIVGRAGRTAAAKTYEV